MARQSAIVISGPWREDGNNKTKLQQIRLLTDAVVGAIEVCNPDDLERVIQEIDGAVNINFLDKTLCILTWNEAVCKVESRIWKSWVLPYADEIVGLIGACHTVVIEANKRGTKLIAVLGGDKRATWLVRYFPTGGLGRLTSSKHL
jgi:hypothetical protein